MSRNRLRLEFAPHARQRSPWAWLLLLLVLLLVALLLVQVGQRWRANAQQRLALSRIEGRPQPAAATTPVPSRSDPRDAARLQQVRQTARQLVTPWADLFAALEAAPSGVALLLVEPSAATRSVALTAEASNATEMLNYLQALQDDPRLTHVVLVSHALQPQVPGTPLRFRLRANWGGTP